MKPFDDVTVQVTCPTLNMRRELLPCYVQLVVPQSATAGRLTVWKRRPQVSL